MQKKIPISLLFTVVIASVALFAANGVMAKGKPQKPPPEPPPPWLGCPEDYPPESCTIKYNGKTITLSVVGPVMADCGGVECEEWTYEATGNLPSSDQFYLMYPVCCPEDDIVLEIIPSSGSRIEPGVGVQGYSFGQGIYNYRMLRFPLSAQNHTYTIRTRPGGSRTSSAGAKISDGFYYCYPGIKAPDCEECPEPPPAGVSSFQQCINLYGKEDVQGDEAHYNVTRLGDAEGCVDTLEICTGLCEDGDVNCKDIVGEEAEKHIIASGLQGQKCTDELFKQSTGSPWYLYETYSGGYYYAACLDLNYPITNIPWVELNCCDSSKFPTPGCTVVP